MRLLFRSASSALGWVASLLILCLAACPTFAQIKSPTNSAAIPANQTNSIAVLAEQANALAAAQLEAMVQLQAQQKAMLQALESSRVEIAGSLATSSSNNLIQLNAMSEMFATQRAQDMRMLRDSNRVMLAILVGMTGLLLLSILFLNLTSVRAMNRLATVFQANALVPTAGEALSGPNSRQMLLFPGEEGQRQLGAALVQLQGRIQSLERTTVKPNGSDAHVASETPAHAAPLQTGKATA